MHGHGTQCIMPVGDIQWTLAALPTTAITVLAALATVQSLQIEFLDLFTYLTVGWSAAIPLLLLVGCFWIGETLIAGLRREEAPHIYR